MPQEHKQNYSDLKVLITFVVVIVIAIWFSINLRSNLDNPIQNLTTKPAVFESKIYPMRSKSEKEIWHAIYDNNTSLLATLLQGQKQYFEKMMKR